MCRSFLLRQNSNLVPRHPLFTLWLRSQVFHLPPVSFLFPGCCFCVLFLTLVSALFPSLPSFYLFAPRFQWTAFWRSSPLIYFPASPFLQTHRLYIYIFSFFPPLRAFYHQFLPPFQIALHLLHLIYLQRVSVMEMKREDGWRMMEEKTLGRCSVCDGFFFSFTCWGIKQSVSFLKPAAHALTVHWGCSKNLSFTKTGGKMPSWQRLKN